MKKKVIIRVFLFMVLFLSHNSFGQENLGSNSIPVKNAYDMIGGGIGCQTTNPRGGSSDIHSVGKREIPGPFGI